QEALGFIRALGEEVEVDQPEPSPGPHWSERGGLLEGLFGMCGISTNRVKVSKRNVRLDRLGLPSDRPFEGVDRSLWLILPEIEIAERQVESGPSIMLGTGGLETRERRGNGLR